MECETIQARVIQGDEKCKATGKIKSVRWFDRQEKKVDDLPNKFKRYYEKMKNKGITKVKMAKLLGGGRATLYRWIELYQEY